ncbi:hypothetical protein PG990_008265 [Apiospora arundinis]|uniref:VOC domain-containing protein n=1 Tax=Apiospora arundinis TaxID=335852 RepID=A0ABR2JNN6_9PEZI
MRPYAEVSRLPESASFYSAVTHPLGLRFLSADSSRIVYGTGGEPVFEVRATGDDDSPLKRARFVLSAPSAQAVTDFHAAGLRAHPDLNKIGKDSHFLRHARPADPSSGGESRAKITDLEGNIMEVVYLPPRDSSSQNGSNVRKTQSTNDEVTRILDWNLDVATSQPAQSVIGSRGPGVSANAITRPPARHVASAPAAAPVAAPAGAYEEEPYTYLRRSVTTSTFTPAPPARESSSGIGTGTIVSTVLGAVAAGAAIGGALTYMNMRNERERAPRQEFDPPAMQRRSTMPDPYPNQHQRYVEVERTVEKIRYPEDMAPPKSARHYPPPSYVARYSQAPDRSREVEEIDDRASRHSTRHSTTGRTRTRSEVGSSRRPLMLAEAEHRSNAGSKHTTAGPKLLMETEYRSQAGSRYTNDYLPDLDVMSRAPTMKPSRHASVRSVRPQEHERERELDAETYVSSRTHRTSRTKATERPERSERHERHERSDRSEYTHRPPPTLVKAETMSIPVRSRPPPPAGRKSVAAMARTLGKSLGATSNVKRMPTGGRATMYAKANMVPLPESEVGGSLADWDDDKDSVAPDDSISCVGGGGGRSRRSSRR